MVVPARAQVPNAPDSRFAGLQWTFVRIKYDAWTLPRTRFTVPEDEPYFIDAIRGLIEERSDTTECSGVGK